MLKKLLKLGMVAGLLTFATTSISAQSTQEYPHYGFWSNWSIGATVDFTKQANSNKLGLGEGTSIGGSIFAEKELNYVWDVRFRAMMPGLISKGVGEGYDANLKVASANHGRYAIHGLFAAEFKFSVNDALRGYNPDRKGSFYLFAGTGVMLYQNYRGMQFHYLNFAMDAGIGYSYKVSNHSTIFAEAQMNDMASIPNIFDKRHHGLEALISLGYSYNFGITAADQELLSQRNMMSQENIDALNEQIAKLEKDVTNGNQTIKRLENRIAELENQSNNNGNINNGGNNQAAKELQAKIDQIKADQLTFYALPFSILYANDQWTISESEQQKLKAIARVMKDNPNTKYVLYGFCDYTGSDEYNMKLSQKRAEEVKRQLVNNYGIAENRLEANWKGKQAPFGDVKYSVNRRVSIYRVIE